MIKAVGIKFYKGNRIYYFSPNNLKLNLHDNVIVETEKGLQFATVCSPINDYDDEKLFLPLKPVIRKATSKDIKINNANIIEANNALLYAKKLVIDLNIDMKLYEASYTFDKKKLIFKFIADERIDFRDLAKKLASKYKTRIELRQIGVRDKAKEIGGLGPCGRPLCCNQFLNDFDSVSINMAKNQGIALNPTKINGSCGRLLCCLGYEDNVYIEYKKNMPKIGQYVEKNNKKGRVIEINILQKKYKILTDDNEIVEMMVN